MSLLARAFAATLLLALPCGAGAHALNPGLLEITERTPGTYTVLWKAPRVATQDASAPSALRPEFPPPCRVGGAQRAGGVAVFALDCAGARVSRVALAGAPGLPTEVLVRSIDRRGRETAALVRGTELELDFPAGAPRSRLETLAGYGTLGLAHISTGLDHLLFVGCLLLLARRLRHLVASVTAFTAAHSVTLALAATGQIRLPQEPVEILIALSVVLAAAEVARGRDRGAGGAARAWGMAFAFGLLHGFGFAGALAETGLPAGRVPSALLGFNLGVEAGQLLFVAAAWWPLRAARMLASRLPPWTAAVPSYAIGCVAAVWTAERVAGAL